MERNYTITFTDVVAYNANSKKEAIKMFNDEHDDYAEIESITN